MYLSENVQRMRTQASCFLGDKMEAQQHQLAH